VNRFNAEDAEEKREAAEESDTWKAVLCGLCVLCGKTPLKSI
jgi:hypothetical protein